MKNMKRLMWGCILIVATGLLAGCGSDGTSLTVDGQRATQALIKALEDQRDTAQANLATTQTKLEEAMANAEDLQTQLTAAQEEVETLTTRITDETDAHDMTKEELDEAKADLADAQEDVNDLRAKLATAQSTIADLQQQVANLTKPTPDAMAQSKLMAIFLADRRGNAGKLSDSRRPGMGTGESEVMVGKQVSLDGDVLGEPDDDVKDNVEFALQSASPVALQDFDGSIHSRTETDDDVTTTDKLYVYTNKENPTDKKYLAYFANTNAHDADNLLDTQRPQAVSSLTDDATSPNLIGVVDGANDGLLTFVDNGAVGATITSIAKEERSLFSGSGWPSGNNRYEDYEDDQDTSGVDERKFQGTFAGIGGTFACTSSTCRAENDGTGKLKMLTGTWTFMPTSLKTDTKVKGVIPDQDYLSFGYWLEETVKDGKTTYGVSPFFGGREPYSVTASTTAGTRSYEQGDMSQLTGKATYEGDATGLFVKKTFTVGDDGGVVGTPTSSGQFTAYAKLEARFGGSEYGQASNFEIDGTVTNFKDSNGAMIDDNWSLTLGDAYFAGTQADSAGYIDSADTNDDNIPDGQGNGGANGTTAPTDYVNIFKGTTSGGRGLPAGEWNGGFFGNPGADTPGSTINITDNYPTSVAGEFTGHFSNGEVIGAFGATK